MAAIVDFTWSTMPPVQLASGLVLLALRTRNVIPVNSDTIPVLEELVLLALLTVALAIRQTSAAPA